MHHRKRYSDKIYHLAPDIYHFVNISNVLTETSTDKICHPLPYICHFITMIIICQGEIVLTPSYGADIEDTYCEK